MFAVGQLQTKAHKQHGLARGLPACSVQCNHVLLQVLLAPLSPSSQSPPAPPMLAVGAPSTQPSRQGHAGAPYHHCASACGLLASMACTIHTHPGLLVSGLKPPASLHGLQLLNTPLPVPTPRALSPQPPPRPPCTYMGMPALPAPA